MRRSVLGTITLLLSLAALAGGVVIENPSDLRPVCKSPIQGLQSGFRPAGAWRAPASDLRPQKLHARPTPSRAQLSGTVTALRAIGADGQVTEIPLDEALDLTGPLPVPDRPVADLELTLDGPVQFVIDVYGRGRYSRCIFVDRLIVAVDDPDLAAQEGEVWLELVADPAEIEAWNLAAGLIASPGSVSAPAPR